MNPRHSYRQIGSLVTPAFAFLWISIYGTAVAETPMDSFEIARVVSRFSIPRVALRNVTIGEALKFYALKYHNVEGDPRPEEFVFDVRLPNEILQRHFSIEAEDISLLEVLKRTFQDIPVSLTFEPGKLIFSSPPVLSNSQSVPK